MEPQSKAAEQIHDLGEFFRQEVAPVHRAVGAARVAEELVRRGMKEAAAVALQVGAELMAPAEPAAPEAWFVMQYEGLAPSSRAPLIDLLNDNRDDAELCAWLLSAKVGDALTTGGGAAPACTLKRVA